MGVDTCSMELRYGKGMVALLEVRVIGNAHAGYCLFWAAFVADVPPFHINVRWGVVVIVNVHQERLPKSVQHWMWDTAWHGATPPSVGLGRCRRHYVFVVQVVAELRLDGVDSTYMHHTTWKLYEGVQQTVSFAEVTHYI